MIVPTIVNYHKNDLNNQKQNLLSSPVQSTPPENRFLIDYDESLKHFGTENVVHILVYQKNQNNKLFCIMQDESNSPIVLLYFKVRGKLQPIRNLCCYLDLPVTEIHLENEDSKRRLSEEVKGALRGMKIDKASLPLLVHEGNLIYDVVPIMNYICRRFNANHLMGKDIRQRARVSELLELILSREPALVNDLFTLAEDCSSKGNQDIAKAKALAYEKCIKDSSFVAETCERLEKKYQGRSFIFENLTLADFLFLETCHLMLGMFSSLVEKRKCALESIFKGLFSSGKQTDTMRHMKVIENFVGLMYHQSFYQKNQQWLESYSMICPSFPVQRVDGLRKIWSYNNNFVV